MGEVKLEMADWLFNAGITGLVNIMREGDIPHSIQANRLQFSTNNLKSFGHLFFQYFESRYIEYVSYTTIIKKGQQLLEVKNWDEKQLKAWNDYIDRTKGLLKSNSYKAAYDIISDSTFDLLAAERVLKKIHLKKNQSIEDIQNEINDSVQKVKEILAYMRKAEVREHIIAKNIAYTVIDNFWSGVSFLHSKATKNNMFMEFDSYFVEPVLNYVNEDHSKDKYSCFVCTRSISKLSKPAAFDLAWLNRIGVDMNRKSSHFWNLNASTCYICPICNLVYSCVPAGFTILRGQGYFVNCNSSLGQLIRLNRNYEEKIIKEDETIQTLELRSYYQIVDLMEQSKSKQAAAEIDNIQIVKYSNRQDNRTDQVRPYTFNILSKDKLNVIQKNQKPLERMMNRFVKLKDDSYINIYQSVLERLYANRNQFDLIAQLIHSNLPTDDKPIRGASSIRDIIYLNNYFLGSIKKIKEDGTMSYASSWVKADTIQDMEKSGKKLYQAYRAKNATNKLSGITYRLLNALKSSHTGRFMDTFVNAHLYVGVGVPTDITTALQDEHKLQTLGYAFIVGLRSSGIGSTENENENETKKGD